MMKPNELSKLFMAMVLLISFSACSSGGGGGGSAGQVQLSATVKVEGGSNQNK